MNDRGKTLCAAVALAVTLLSIVLGVHDDLPQPGKPRTAPRWSRHLAPIAHAPVPPGHEVLLLLPHDLSPLDAQRLFFETVWWRPSIRWRPVRTLDAGAGTALAVCIHPGRPGQTGAVPKPWHDVWSSGWIHVLARSGS